MSCNVAFIGLGVMGYPMAGYISKGGHNVTVYNRTGAKADKWLKDFKGKKADTPKDAAKDADYIFTCVGNDNDLREVTFGENGIFKSIKKGAVYIDNTTASATIAREIYDYAKKNGFGALNNPKKKLCPKLEKNVNMNPKKITFLFIERLIIYEL